MNEKTLALALTARSSGVRLCKSQLGRPNGLPNNLSAPVGLIASLDFAFRFTPARPSIETTSLSKLSLGRGSTRIRPTPGCPCLWKWKSVSSIGLTSLTTGMQIECLSSTVAQPVAHGSRGLGCTYSARWSSTTVVELLRWPPCRLRHHPRSFFTTFVASGLCRSLTRSLSHILYHTS